MQLDALFIPGLQYTPGSFQSGAGSPENVVSAPVGTVYEDTANTAGATLWVKSVGGSGNTGWRTVYGDTGIRILTTGAYALNGWTWGSLSVRRINGVVEVRWTGLDGSAATAGGFLTLPFGFTPGGSVYTGVNTLASGLIDTTSGITIAGGGAFTCRGAVPTATQKWGGVSYLTGDLWPTVLP